MNYTNLPFIFPVPVSLQNAKGVIFLFDRVHVFNVFDGCLSMEKKVVLQKPKSRGK